VIPLLLENNQYGNGIGYEVNAAYDVSKSLRLLADYSYLQLNLADRPGSVDYTVALIEGEAPKHQGRITGYWNPHKRISFDNSIYFVDRLPSQAIPGYVSVVSHLGVQIAKGVNANFLADNLFDRRHLEFHSALDAMILSQAFGRTVRAGITWQF
jgi:outer membrane receptor protein involved in Fe transport